MRRPHIARVLSTPGEIIPFGQKLDDSLRFAIPIKTVWTGWRFLVNRCFIENHIDRGIVKVDGSVFFHLACHCHLHRV